MDFDTAGGASFGTQSTANAFFFIYLSKATSVNGDSVLGAGFHTDTTGNTNLLIWDSELLHIIILFCL